MQPNYNKCSVSSQYTPPNFFKPATLFTPSKIKNLIFDTIDPINNGDIDSISSWRCFCFYGVVARRPKRFIDYSTGKLIEPHNTYSKRIYYPFGIEKGQIRIGSLTPAKANLHNVLTKYKESNLNIALGMGVIAKNNNPYVIVVAEKSKGESFPLELAEELNMSLWMESTNKDITLAIGKTTTSLKDYRMQLGTSTNGYRLYLNHSIMIPNSGKIEYLGDRKMAPEDIIKHTQKSLDYRIAIKATFIAKPRDSYISVTSPQRDNNWEWGINNRKETFGFLQGKIKPSQSEIKAVLYHAYDKALNTPEFEADSELINGLMWNVALTIVERFKLKGFTDNLILRIINEVVAGYIDFRTASDFILDLMSRGIIQQSTRIIPVMELRDQINSAMVKINTLTRYGHLDEKHDVAQFSTRAIRISLEELNKNFTISKKDNVVCVNLEFNQKLLGFYLHSLTSSSPIEN